MKWRVKGVLSVRQPSSELGSWEGEPEAEASTLQGNVKPPQNFFFCVQCMLAWLEFIGFLLLLRRRARVQVVVA